MITINHSSPPSPEEALRSRLASCWTKNGMWSAERFMVRPRGTVPPLRDARQAALSSGWNGGREGPKRQADFDLR